MFLIFDTETTGLPKNYNAPLTDSDNWPRMVQIAWQLHDSLGVLLDAKNYIIKPEGYEIPHNAVKIHGISTEKALKDGVDLEFVLHEFEDSLKSAIFIVGHNIQFDINILGAEYYRKNVSTDLLQKSALCTKEQSTDFCALPGGKGGNYKWPTLSELHTALFNKPYDEAHNAAADVAATTRCFLELIRVGVIGAEQLQENDQFIQLFKELNITPFEAADVQIVSNREPEVKQAGSELFNKTSLKPDVPFTHLHVHTQYSILDGAADIDKLFQKAKADGMIALAITDHGSMFGAKLFHKTAKKAGIKAIIGCEAYVARRSRKDKNDKIDASGDHLILLAKNLQGYHNLSRIISYGFLEGMYYKPRIDKELLRQYKDGLIALTACLGGEVPRRIAEEGVESGEAAILEYKEIFGDDFYLELQRHPSGDPKMYQEVYQTQVYVNKVLVELAQKHHIKYVATNDVHFINEEDAEAHDRLICISTQKDLNDPQRMRYTQQEWFKTCSEMRDLFADLPDALSNTLEITEKIEEYKLDTSPIMPYFELPQGYPDEDAYLRHLTYEGALKRWTEISQQLRDRLDFELETIKKMGYPGYFLIVWDFLREAREMGVSVGPGRGSAAGSVVAYCLRITEIDPVKYDLLFERFLNPDRISQPDIDIDFDEDGRGKVLDYVVKKYGEKRVAHIITFGTMAAKSAIRDVARVQGLPLPESDRLAKLVPERPGISLKEAYQEVPELKDAYEHGSPEVSSVLKYAEILEGSVRNVGTHACGVIIGRDDLEKHIPISTAKDSELTYVTQYDGKHVEDVGLLKMDFLGLKTLSIIKDTIDNIKLSKGIEVDIDNLPLDDKVTYELYSRGETTALFQFESDGMKKYLKELKPSRFEDLIAMNALYRPGPMDYIPEFIARKHGRAKISYDFPIMEEILKETYGITVYQEQVMQLSRIMAGFTMGEADSLRKAMGKKIQSMMDELRPKFIEGCKTTHNLDEAKVARVWEDWEKFASYAFNKSHATCYSFVSYQTAYLKAHYPAEFMASVLSRNLSDIKKITFFMDECKRMNMKVLGPDINESYLRFTVNKEGNIRFGLAAIKGVGEAAVEHIVKERDKNGGFNDIYDFVKRVNLSTVNKKNLEALATAGAFDSFAGIKRYQYLANDDKGISYVENLIRYGNKLQSEVGSSPTLFGGTNSIEIVKPEPPPGEEWPVLMKLNKEKELIGMYLSSHPLDNFKFELKHLRVTPLSELADLNKLKGKEISIAGIVGEANERITKTGKPYGTMVLEDYSDTYTLVQFSKDYLDFKSYFTKGYYLIVKGKIQEKQWKTDNPELEFKVLSMSMLSEVRDEVFKNLQVKVQLNSLRESMISEINNFTHQKKGKLTLKFLVYDTEKNLSVELFSRNTKLNLTEELIDYLEHNNDFTYKIN